MKISVITVCFNSVDTIEDCVQSVLGQDYSDVEYVVIDGASTDGTLELLNNYRNQISTLISEPDQGIYDAMNKGLTHCKGDVIAILNSDDLYRDNSVLSRVVQYLTEKQVAACYGDLEYVDRSNTNKVVRFWRAGQYHRKKFLHGWMPPHPAFFLKRSCYQEHGFFDLRFTTSADYELMLRMLYKHELTCAYIPEVLVRMRVGGQSNLSLANRLKANREDRFAWQVNGLTPRIYTTILKPLSKIGQFLKRS
ncbi:MAG: glycosyltransferase [Cryomorphaceae bacterium]|nr:MAG: glycosyltransferase [Cryomorphaceae bacterium]